MSNDLINAAHDLSMSLRSMKFAPPVAFVYNPLEYAEESYAEYLRRYAHAGVQAVLLGMNPGPFGMAQTGVPFGDVAMVRDWLGIRAKVNRPDREHPKRPIAGFGCHRCEVSGQRVWGWARERYGVPDSFFQKFFVANYCPLCFMEESGRNRTPDKLPSTERESLFAACDEHLRRCVAYLRPKWVIGIGQFASMRATVALAKLDGIQVGQILHPSPASPIANKGWAAQAEEKMRILGIRI